MFRAEQLEVTKGKIAHLLHAGSKSISCQSSYDFQFFFQLVFLQSTLVNLRLKLELVPVYLLHPHI